MFIPLAMQVDIGKEICMDIKILHFTANISLFPTHIIIYAIKLCLSFKLVQGDMPRGQMSWVQMSLGEMWIPYKN